MNHKNKKNKMDECFVKKGERHKKNNKWGLHGGVRYTYSTVLCIIIMY